VRNSDRIGCDPHCNVPKGIGERNHGRVSFEFLEPRYLLSAGNLDPNFGGGTGQVAVQFQGGGGIAVVQDSIVQPDGKTILVGDTSDAGNGTDFGVARINADDTPDLTFGNSGVLRIQDAGLDGKASHVRMQSDGKIVVAGGFDQPEGSTTALVFAVVRLDPNGDLDSSFGTNGIATTNFTTDPTLPISAFAMGVAIQDDGKILVSGNTAYTNGPGVGAVLVRYNLDGTLDPTFGTGGVVNIDLAPDLGAVASGDDNEFAGDVAIQQGGDIFVSGSTATHTIYGVSSFTFEVAAYTADGTLDQAFGNGGLGRVSFPKTARLIIPYVRSLIIQPDGKLVEAGYAIYANSADSTTWRVGNALARLNANGVADRSFGKGGLTIDSSAPVFAIQKAILEPDGRILTSGLAASSYPALLSKQSSPFVAQYQPNGRIDRTFGDRGVVTLSQRLPSNSTVASAAKPLRPFQLQPADTQQSDSSLHDAFQALTNEDQQIALITAGGEIEVIGSDQGQVIVSTLIGNGPDITASFNALKAGNFIGGTAARISVRIYNRGNEINTGAIDVSLFLSTQPHADDAAVAVATATNPSHLRGGGGATAMKFQFNYPSVPDGQYYFLVTTSLQGQADTDPSNDAASSDIAVGIMRQHLQLSGASTAIAGPSPQLSLDLTNVGNIIANGSLLLDFFASSDGAFDSNSVPLNISQSLKIKLSPSRQKSFRFRLPSFSSLPSGDYYIISVVNTGSLQADDGSQIVIVSQSTVAAS